MPYAIIKTGGKQFVVEQGHTVRIPSIAADAGKSIELDALLTAGDGDSPVVGVTKVAATVVEHGRGQISGLQEKAAQALQTHSGASTGFHSNSN